MGKLQIMVRGLSDALGIWGAIVTLITAIPALILPWIYFPSYLDAALVLGMLTGSAGGLFYTRASYTGKTREACVIGAKRYVGHTLVDSL